jgi:hypothetical protein
MKIHSLSSRTVTADHTQLPSALQVLRAHFRDWFAYKQVIGLRDSESELKMRAQNIVVAFSPVNRRKLTIGSAVLTVEVFFHPSVLVALYATVYL